MCCDTSDLHQEWQRVVVGQYGQLRRENAVYMLSNRLGRHETHVLENLHIGKDRLEKNNGLRIIL